MSAFFEAVLVGRCCVCLQEWCQSESLLINRDTSTGHHRTRPREWGGLLVGGLVLGQPILLEPVDGHGPALLEGVDRLILEVSSGSGDIK
jgi:hypothetical protein